MAVSTTNFTQVSKGAYVLMDQQIIVYVDRTSAHVTSEFDRKLTSNVLRDIADELHPEER
jgi:hypothetical protein